MAEEKDNGGPAFGIQSLTQNAQSHRVEGGVTIRDYFAAHAVIGLFAGDERSAGDFDEQLIAANAYRLADAMLKARANN